MTPVVKLVTDCVSSDVISLGTHSAHQLQLFSGWWYIIDNQPRVGPFPTATEAAKAGVTAALSQRERRGDASVDTIHADQDGDA